MRGAVAGALLVVLGAPGAAAAQLTETSSAAEGPEPGSRPRSGERAPAPEDDDGRDPEAEEEAYRNPKGTWSVGGTLGLASGPDRTSFVVGANVGYAVLTGVLPGVRGLLVIGDGVGGELAATLTYTPPFTWAVTPFALVEGGRRWLSGLSGWLYGAGVGVYLGDPAAWFNVQLGYIWRQWAVDDGPTVDVSAPIVGLSVRF